MMIGQEKHRESEKGKTDKRKQGKAEGGQSQKERDVSNGT